MWKCEEKFLEEWNNFFELVVDLLSVLVDYLRKGKIVYYFILENNLIDNIRDDVFVFVVDGITVVLVDFFTILYRVFFLVYNI